MCTAKKVNRQARAPRLSPARLPQSPLALPVPSPLSNRASDPPLLADPVVRLLGNTLLPPDLNPKLCNITSLAGKSARWPQEG